MSIWIIEPREPLIFRDGRPFNANPGANANSLPFPFPSTTTGAARTRAGSDEHGNFIRSPKDVLQLRVRGPLLVHLAEKNSAAEELEWLAPAPADALLLKQGNDERKRAEESGEQESSKATLIRLQPINAKGALTDLDELSRQAELHPPLMLVGPAEGQENVKREKPLAPSQVPAFWRWPYFEKWLMEPPTRAEVRDWNTLGIFGLPGEQRIHITFDKNLHSAKDEALFETNGREFTAWDAKQNSLSAAHQLALAVIVDEDAKDSQEPKLAPRAGFDTLGGERRIVRWRSSTTPLPQCPPALIEQVARERACRIILLTPAYFARGCYPQPASLQRPGVTPQLRALAVNRPQIVSGWDFAKGGPKPTCHLTPAGSVLFLSLDGEKADIERWVKATWLQCIGDNEQFCNDGFGLAVIGTWNV